MHNTTVNSNFLEKSELCSKNYIGDSLAKIPPTPKSTYSTSKKALKATGWHFYHCLASISSLFMCQDWIKNETEKKCLFILVRVARETIPETPEVMYIYQLPTHIHHQWHHIVS